MKVIQIEIPEKLAEELQALVEEGWFHNEAEAVRYALADLLKRHRLKLMERFQLQDIAWALEQKEERN